MDSLLRSLASHPGKVFFFAVTLPIIMFLLRTNMLEIKKMASTSQEIVTVRCLVDETQKTVADVPVVNLAFVGDDDLVILNFLRTFMRFRTGPVHVFLLTPTKFIPTITDTINSWLINPDTFQYTFISYQECRERSSKLTSAVRYDAKMGPLCMLLLHELLPENVSHVLAIRVTWPIWIVSPHVVKGCWDDPLEHLKKFIDAKKEEDQPLFGMTVDSSDRAYTESDDAWPHPKDQYNSNVIFLNLARIRQVNFTATLVNETEHYFQQTQRFTRSGEQCIINYYAYLNPKALFEIPCGCNYQVSGSRFEELCPSPAPIYIVNRWGGDGGAAIARTQMLWSPYVVEGHTVRRQNEWNSPYE
eukprot:TRINITY_DN5881_c0_g1_i1.p1 TRINITY_DN5881_c0_g1~~TRINITY_DN5881_c0_g1_i1.p1  ORF type:complete len:359 (+),score=57.16 TRINITY_DN5881_c0_g1_i1:218-1294(+)